jgi:glucose/mannose-6-phosphate isomerase
MQDTNILNSREKIAEIDEHNVLGSVEALPDQCEDAYLNASKVDVPDIYRQYKHVIMTGMGGSGLGARVIESVFAKELKVPLIRVNDYNLPPFTSEDSLVICSSYSGTTEETIENINQAIYKNAKWMVIGTGGELIQMAKDGKVPYYEIDAKFNPSDQPRMAIGYSVFGQLVLASKAGLFDLHHPEVQNAIDVMKGVQKENTVEIPFEENEAKKLAQKMHGKNIFYIASEHLIGAMHTVNNQLNENAKAFSADFQIPELNHHLMEGLKHPSTNPDKLFMLFANSNLYPDRIRKRFEVTAEVVEKNGIEYYVFETSGKDKLTQAFELMQFGAYVNLYLSVLYGQNPAPIPWVDYFKEKLSTL